jgi:hypothetical protein
MRRADEVLKAFVSAAFRATKPGQGGRRCAALYVILKIV